MLNKNIFLSLTLFFCSFFTLFADELDSLVAKAYVLSDAETGRILISKNENAEIPPASMMKVMTLFLTYDALDRGDISKDQLVKIGKVGSAFSRPADSSLMRLEEGQVVSVLDLMKGVAVCSGNDAAYALANLVGPGVGPFIRQMNKKAHDLGLTKSSFVDPDGYSENNIITPLEYEKLARAYIKSYPQALEELHSVPFMVYPLPQNLSLNENSQITVPRRKNNTNILLQKVQGVDGLKTGYTPESGFNFTATAKRGDTRLIAVVTGVFMPSYYQGILQRAEDSKTLIEFGFSHYKKRELPFEALSIPVYKGKENRVSIDLDENIRVLLSEKEYDLVRIKESHIPFIEAPLKKGTPVGEVQFYLGETLLAQSTLLTQEDLIKGSIFKRLIDWFKLLFRS